MPAQTKLKVRFEMTNTTNFLRNITYRVAAIFGAVALSISIAGSAQAQTRTHVIGKTMQMPNPQLLNQMKAAQNRRITLQKKGFSKAVQKTLNGATSAAERARAKGNAARQIRQNAKMRQMFKQKLTSGPKGILKKPGATSANKRVKFNKKPLGKGPKYRAKHIAKKNVRFPGKNAKTFKNVKNAKNLRNASKAAQKARAAKNVYKASKAAKLAIAGTGVGAVATIGAGMAGLDPVEMATLKATNPAEYNRRMRDLKKNPVKYVGKNVANNTKKAVQNVGNAGKKVGCGIGNTFKKKKNRKKC